MITSCVVSAYKGQEILEIQQKQYIDFVENQEEIEAKISRLIEVYYSSKFGSVEEVSKFQSHIKPTELVIQRALLQLTLLKNHLN